LSILCKDIWTSYTRSSRQPARVCHRCQLLCTGSFLHLIREVLSEFRCRCVHQNDAIATSSHLPVNGGQTTIIRVRVPLLFSNGRLLTTSPRSFTTTSASTAGHHRVAIRLFEKCCGKARCGPLDVRSRLPWYVLRFFFLLSLSRLLASREPPAPPIAG
jgi:hypothetical protein